MASFRTESRFRLWLSGHSFADWILFVGAVGIFGVSLLAWGSSLDDGSFLRLTIFDSSASNSGRLLEP
jgi:hypothetical protein